MTTPTDSAHGDGRERRRLPLSEDQIEEIEEIAEKAAEKAIEKLTNHVYQEVGRSIVSKLFYIVGACSLCAYLWLKNKGIL